MNLSDVIDAIKAFFLDFLGYFLPGLYAIIILAYTIDISWHFNSKQINFIRENEVFVVLLFAYILGYVIYSINICDFFSRWNLLHIKAPKRIENEIKSSVEFEQCKNILIELWVNKSNSPVLSASTLNALEVHNLRNIIMSYLPEYDAKVYTFMFRSDLCKHISSFSILCSLLGIIFSAMQYLFVNNIKVFNSNYKFICLYFLLLIVSYFLMKTRSRFLSIAYKIPFSMFLSKYYKLN